MGKVSKRQEGSEKQRAKWCRIEGYEPRNMHKQAAKETMKNCSQEVDLTEPGVDRLLTRSENKNGRTQGLIKKNKVFHWWI